MDSKGTIDQPASATVNGEQSLLAANAELRARLEEAEETLNAIRSGEVDALVVEGPLGSQIYTLQSADAESNQLRGEILSQISDAVVATDNEQLVTYINAAAERQYGIPASEALGRSLSELWTCEWVNAEDEASAARALRDVGSWRGENVHVTRARVRIYVESAVIALQDAKGARIGLLSTIRDITERKEAEIALSDAARRKDEFLAMLGHELRNPLTAIRHAVQIARESPNDPGAHEWASEVVDRQSVQLARMVDDLLDVARINRGRVELRFETLDLRPVLAGAIAVVRSLMEQKSHAFTSEIADHPLRVRGDAARLEQVFVNLLNNAAKYTPARGQICLIAGSENNEAIVSIADNGVGIAPELLPHVFELFTQAHTSLDRSQGGLGIGLTVVKSLIEMHGGRVGAQSEGALAGTTFTVRLPLFTGSDSVDDEIKPHATAAPLSRNVRVLIVDDHVDSAEALSRLLVRRNCQVRIANDGSTGAAIARDFQPEVLLLDLGLPGLDGYELARALRADPVFKDALFIAISGYAQESDRERSLAAGFDHHCAKPVDCAALLSIIGSTFS